MKIKTGKSVFGGAGIELVTISADDFMDLFVIDNTK
jgi:hypothetical protein